MSKETLGLGFVLIGSGLSEFLSSLIFVPTMPELREVIGLALALLGFILCVWGQIWTLEGDVRPVGVAVLSFGFAIGGVFSLVLAVLSENAFVSVALSIMSMVIFALAYLFLEGNFLGWVGVALLTFVGLLGSLVGVGNSNIVNVQGVLVSAFVLWYLFRPHVTKFFHQEPLRIDFKRKHIVLPLIFALLIFACPSYLYANPPSRTISSSMAESGSPWGGAGGSSMVYGKADVLHFTYNVTSKWPIKFVIGSNYDAPIATTSGMNGTGEATVPASGEYDIYYAPLVGYEASLSVTINVQMYSLRPALFQWILLDTYLILALFALALFKRTRQEVNLAGPPAEKSMQISFTRAETTAINSA